MACCQKDDLRQAADEGFQDIEEQFGRTNRWVDNPLQYYQQPGPQLVTVFRKPGFSSTSATYFDERPRVPPRKEAGIPRSNLQQATHQGQGVPNSYQVPPTIRAKDSVIKTSGGWYVCRVPQVPPGKGDVITSEQAAKNYGGYLTRDYGGRSNYYTNYY